MMISRPAFAFAFVLSASSALAQLDGPLPLAWRWSTSNTAVAEGSPVMSGNTAIIAVGGRLYAIDKYSGNQRWKFPVAEAISGAFRNPTILGNIIAVPASTNVMYGISTSGKQLWTYTSLEERFSGHPVASGNMFVVSLNDRSLLALNAETGRAEWPKPLEVPTGLKGYIAAYRGNVLFFNNNNELNCLDTASARVLWKVRFENISANATPFVMNDTLYVYTGGFLAALQGSNGRPVWQRPLSGSPSFGPAVNAHGILIVDREGVCTLLDTTGRPKPNGQIELGSAPATAPVAVGDKFLIPTINGVLNMVDAKTGDVVWSYVVRPVVQGLRDQRLVGEEEYVGIAAAGEPVVAGNTLLVLGQDGTLMAFDRQVGVDLTGPEIEMGWPRPGSQVNGLAPFALAFRVRDEAAGVDAENLKITVNGKEMEYEFGRDGIAVVRFTKDGVNGELSEGRTTIEVAASDWLGNTAKSTFSLTIDNLLPPLQQPGQKSPTIKPAGGRGGRGGGRGGRGGGRAGG